MIPINRHDRAGTRRERGVVASEFVVVAVFVIGLLIVVAVSVHAITKDSTASDCRTELRALKIATEQYKAETGSYPVGKGAVVDKGLAKASDVADYDLEPSDDGTVPKFQGIGRCR